MSCDVFLYGLLLSMKMYFVSFKVVKDSVITIIIIVAVIGAKKLSLK